MTESYAIFASGSGSNALSLINKGIELNHLPSFLLVNKKEAGVIAKAKETGVHVILIETKHPKVDLDFESEVLAICREYKIKWIFLAGFMKILSKSFLENFKEDKIYQVINIHPSLLPLYKGLNAYEKAYDANDDEYGFTIHFVDERIDHGEIIFQKVIKRLENDSFDEFKKRGLILENKYYPQVLEKILNNKKLFLKDKNL